MEFIFRWLLRLEPGRLVTDAVFGSLIGIAAILALILVRRGYRRRYFRRLEAHSLALRKKWEGIVSGAVPPETWRANRLDREIVETLLLDALEVAPPSEASRLLNCLRSSGVLDKRIAQARKLHGWRRRRALANLGRTRAPEAIAAMVDALDDPQLQTRMAAVWGLGRIGLPEAAPALLDHLLEDNLNVPARPLQNALIGCCRSRPALLLPYLRRAKGTHRELLARVLGEVATPDLTDDLLVLAGDPLPEVRASVARAISQAKPSMALPALMQLARDPEWFVRLRAVAGLDAVADSKAIPALVAAACDSNRYVRLRAAAALARMEPHLEQILAQVVESQDRYALQAMISELERTGSFQKLLETLADPARPCPNSEFLLEALRQGTEEMSGTTAPKAEPEKVAR